MNRAAKDLIPRQRDPSERRASCVASPMSRLRDQKAAEARLKAADFGTEAEHALPPAECSLTIPAVHVQATEEITSANAKSALSGPTAAAVVSAVGAPAAAAEVAGAAEVMPAASVEDDAVKPNVSSTTETSTALHLSEQMKESEPVSSATGASTTVVPSAAASASSAAGKAGDETPVLGRRNSFHEHESF
eukprot:TRINITY_DN1253_c0_g3_i6.p2 TRINITY_DN1253_c0_g3~~TRINITY_DN1253_c0_g3_i6.p2  ORF type:complete len:191 (-),score=38.63 TRINITY_DN1253_c0_g3_i6:22-594(-)